MKHLALIALVVVVASSVQALELTVGPSFRSYPQSGSIEASARHEYLIWDRREEALWKFGYVQPKVTVGAHGLLDGTLNIAPISILELGAGYGTTSRFYKSSTFNCDEVICGGVVTRHRLSAKLLAGWQMLDLQWMVMALYSRVRFSNADHSQMLVDETEVLLAAPGSDVLETSSLVFGARRDHQALVAVARQGRYLDADTRNQSQYLVYREKHESLSWAVGVGRWASDHSQPGFSALGSVLWTWGQSQALF